jgi:hypothetical protein
MYQAGRDPDLLEEPARELAARAHERMQYLERDDPVVPEIPGFVDRGL